MSSVSLFCLAVPCSDFSGISLYPACIYTTTSAWKSSSIAPSCSLAEACSSLISQGEDKSEKKTGRILPSQSRH